MLSETYRTPEYGPRDRRTWLRDSYKSTGNMASYPAGNVVGTENTGGSFTWLR